MKQTFVSDNKEKQIKEWQELGEKRLRYPPNDTYYNPNKRKSYQPYLSMIIAARGPGKTVGELTAAMRDYFRKGKRFVYVRRYKTDMKQFIAKHTVEKLCDGVKCICDGADGSSYKYIDMATGEEMGYALVLSVSYQYKSTKFENIGTIIFDEFLINPSALIRYLDNEPMVFMNLVSTIMRDAEDVDIVMLGNNEDLFNPYFIFFNIPRFKDFYWDNDRRIYIENYKPSEKWKKKQKESALYQLTNNTSFQNYAYRNEWIGDKSKGLIREKPHNSHLFLRCRMEKTTLNIYRCDVNGEEYLWCEVKAKIYEDNITYNIITENEYKLLDCASFRNKFSKFIYRYYYQDKVRYGSTEAGNYFQFIVTKILK